MKHVSDDDRHESGEDIPRQGMPIDPAAIPRPEGTVDIEQDAPTLASLYGINELERHAQRGLISLASMPKWPQTGNAKAVSPTGHGWGTHLNDMLGGGIAPGEIIAVGAASAGGGKTYFTMQLADGLALQSEARAASDSRDVLTPVLVLSEMPVAALTWRSLARWTGAAARTFRAGSMNAESADWHNARRALDPRDEVLGAFQRSRQWTRVLRTPEIDAGGPAVSRSIGDVVRRWRDRIAVAHPHAQGVVPIVVIDPIQRFQGEAKSEIEGLNLLVESLGRETEKGDWACIITSDTTKAQASGSDNEGKRSDQERVAAVFRGSYKLQHLAVATIALEREGEGGIDSDGFIDLRAIVGKNRWGHSGVTKLRWHAPTGRMLPKTEREARASADNGASRGKGREAETQAEDEGIPDVSGLNY